MTAGETAQVEANMNVVHNILDGGTYSGSKVQSQELQLAA